MNFPFLYIHKYAKDKRGFDMASNITPTKIENTLKGFSDRVQNISYFKPLLSLEDKNYAGVESKYLFVLGLASLLFILENEVEPTERYTTKKNLADFLEIIAIERLKIPFTSEDAARYSEVIVEHFRNGGKQFRREYFDLETSQNMHYDFDILRESSFDESYGIKEAHTETRFNLTSDGQSMLFVTREIFGEFSFQLNLLLLKKMLEQGTFTGVYDVVRSLNAGVYTELQNLKDLQRSIMQNALEVSKKDLVNQRLERLNYTLESDKKRFDEITALLVDIKEKNISYQEKKKIDVELIVHTEKELNALILAHGRLFIEKQNIQTILAESLTDNLLNAFNTSINFEKEILGAILTKRMTDEVVANIVKPIIPIKPVRRFSWSKLNEEQVLEDRIKKEVEGQELQEVSEETEKTILKEEFEAKIAHEAFLKEMLWFLFNELIEKDELLCSDLIKTIRKEDDATYHKFIDDGDLFNLIITLHQWEEVGLTAISSDIEDGISDPITISINQLAKEHKAFSDIGLVSFIPVEGELIEFEDGDMLTDFKILKIGRDQL